MARKSGKKLALWVSADNTTPPTAGDQVAYITSINPQHSIPETDVTASQDDYGVFVFGIATGSANISGRLDLTSPSGQRQFEDWVNAGGDPRLIRIVYDTDDPDGYVEVSAGITNLTQTGTSSASWDFSATLRFASQPTFSQTSA